LSAKGGYVFEDFMLVRHDFIGYFVKPSVALLFLSLSAFFLVRKMMFLPKGRKSQQRPLVMLTDVVNDKFTQFQYWVAI